MKRRRALQLGLGGLAALGTNPLPLFGVRKAMADTPETTVYVSNAGSKDIYVLAINRTTGALDLIEKVLVPGTDKPSPASLPMAMSPDRRFLYAQLRSDPFPVSAFALDPASGKLTHLGATPLVDQMAYLNVDRSGKYLLCASYVGAKVAIYPIKPDHTVEAKATQIVDTKPKAHCVFIDSANRNVYVPVLGGDIVMEFRFDPATGTVTPNAPGEIATKPNAGPRHFTIHPNKSWGYLITETTATIGTYAINPDNGTLSEIAFVDTGDWNGKESAAASDIHVTPDGKFVYGGARDQHAARLQGRSRQGHADGDRQVADRENAARLQHRASRQVPVGRRDGFGGDDRPCHRPGLGRAQRGRALPDGDAAELGRNRRPEGVGA